VANRGWLKYIELPYKQTAAKRINSKSHVREKYGDILGEIFICIEQVRVDKDTFSYLMKNRIEAIEALLIYMNQQVDNKQFRRNYGRRPNLTARSQGCPYLLTTVWAVEGVCFSAGARPVLIS
jgi:hypothetical protein